MNQANIFVNQVNILQINGPIMVTFEELLIELFLWAQGPPNNLQQGPIPTTFPQYQNLNNQMINQPQPTNVNMH